MNARVARDVAWSRQAHACLYYTSNITFRIYSFFSAHLLRVLRLRLACFCGAAAAAAARNIWHVYCATSARAHARSVKQTHSKHSRTFARTSVFKRIDMSAIYNKCEFYATRNVLYGHHVANVLGAQRTGAGGRASASTDSR